MSIIEKAVDKLSSNIQRGGGDQVEAETRLDQGTDSTILASEQNKTAPSVPPTTAAAAETAVIAEQGRGEREEVEVRLEDLELEGVLSSEGGRSRLAEEFRMIKRPLLLKASSKESSPSSPSNLIMVTSALSGEGKTFTSMNLAISIAMEMDRTVLLIDADLAKPNLSRILNTDEQPGFTECLKDDNLDLGQFLLRTDVPKLTILPAGQRHNRATELLASNNMETRLHELSTRYQDRILIFDSPPLLATSEASALARHMGQIAMVVEYGATPQFLIKEALGVLDDRAKVSLILNKARTDLLFQHVGSYGYGYGYGSGKGYGYGAYGDQ